MVASFIKWIFLKCHRCQIHCNYWWNIWYCYELISFNFSILIQWIDNAQRILQGRRGMWTSVARFIWKKIRFFFFWLKMFQLLRMLRESLMSCAKSKNLFRVTRLTYQPNKNKNNNNNNNKYKINPISNIIYK